ncbi:GNAT family N-acetyltransferase [Microvirga pakistanensis]|uniref:GNAT family N-acetyltransferase n=1 Tax=Microvirga pakistanensis TaxID=1682650 RepID=UPI00106BF6B5|nr:GNAT family N-acetyltransferase [Microvirga pakistanensis]
MGDGIRTARRDELKEIGQLYHAVWRETQASLQPASVAAYRDEAFFVARARRFPTAPLVALSQGRILGFAAWTGCRLGQLYVLPEGRSLGIGRALLERSENAIRAGGFECAELHCLVGNDSARRFYERCGWRHTATLMEEAETLNGPVEVACWEMTKELVRA